MNSLHLKLFQKCFNYSQDGPGNRLVYHLQGCNLRCPWCSNPEGIPINGCLLQTQQTLCNDSCPHNAICDNQLNREICKQCTARECTVLYDSGLKRSERELPLQAVLDEIRRSAIMFFDGGGVTFTGGEATLQFEALRELLPLLKKDNIHIAIETNGTHPRLPELFPFIDWLIMDFKHYDVEKHREWLGISNEVLLQNLRTAAKTREQLLIRIPLINHFNASAEDAEHFAKLLSDLVSDKVQVELLRYHEYGKDKWKQCGLPYTMQDGFITDEQLSAFVNVLKSRQIPLIHT